MKHPEWVRVRAFGLGQTRCNMSRNRIEPTTEASAWCDPSRLALTGLLRCRSGRRAMLTGSVGRVTGKSPAYAGL